MKKEPITQSERDEFMRTINNVIGSGNIQWIAVSVKFDDGLSMAYHSKNAPKRPRGLVA